MRKIITAVLGILCGIAIIVMAFQFNSSSATPDIPSFDPIDTLDIYTGSYEDNEYYGGDAYTGIQQAAAQTANNVLALEETLEQTNYNLIAINKNIKTTNEKLVDTSAMFANLGFYLLLSIGALTIVRYLGLFLDGIADNRQKKSAKSTNTTASPAESNFSEQPMSYSGPQTPYP